MTTRNPTTFIVGAGPVATTLAGALRLGGVPVLGLWARKAAQATFDWRHVIARYQALWAELAERRRAAVESAPANGPLYWPARADPFTLFADYPTELLSPQHRLEPGDFPRELAAIVAHDLFGFAKHRLRLDLCELIQRKAAERPGATLAEIGAALGEPERALLPRNATFLVKVGLLRLRPRA